MNRREAFTESYAVAWLAAYAASHYEETCALDRHGRYDDQPIEDAYHLAKLAWNSRVSILGDPMSESDIPTCVPTLATARSERAALESRLKKLRARIRALEKFEEGDGEEAEE